MAKNSWNDYSSTNASNSDIQSIDISEGCSPSNINNAIRELMVDTANVVSGSIALSSINIDGGAIDGTAIGANSASTGAFTTLSTSSNVSVTGNITVSGTVDGRDVATDGSKLDGIESGATADQSAAEILTLIKTVDGSGSGLDADLLDGISSASFLRSDADDTYTGILSFGSSGSRIDGSDTFPLVQVNSSKAYFGSTQRATSVLASSNTIVHNRGGTEYTIWTAYNDGAGSGLDADTLDGSHASAFLTGNQTITLSGDVTGSGSTSISTSIAANAVGASELNVSGNGSTSQFLRSDGDGSFSWATPTDTNTDTTYSAGTGLNLSGTTFSADINGTTQTVAANSVTATAGRTYAVQAVSGGDLVVNVPWVDTNTDTNTTYSAGTALTLSGTTFSVTDNGIGATQLNVSGNGTTSQFLRSDGDGTFTWATPTDTNTTYTAGGDYGITLSGTEFRLEDDRRRNSTSTDVYSGNTHDYTFYDASVGIRWYTAGAEDMRLTDAGDLHVDGNVTAYSTTISDKRLKENIEPVENALNKIQKLTGYTFTYKNSGRESAGVIAQDIEQVMPSAVNETELPLEISDGQKYKTVQYDQLHALLIEAIKELTDKVERLENGAPK